MMMLIKFLKEKLCRGCFFFTVQPRLTEPVGNCENRSRGTVRIKNIVITAEAVLFLLNSDDDDNACHCSQSVPTEIYQFLFFMI
jgi:hypothetical protein